MGFFPFYHVFVILDDFSTILKNLDFGFFPFHLIFVILDDFSTILRNFDFEMFPILSDFCRAA